MDRFRIDVIAATANPQQVIWAAMHQDYSEGFVVDGRDRWPDETQAGELVIKHLLAGNRGHYGPLEHPQITFNVGYFPHSMMQQVRTHRVGVSFDVQCLSGDTEITFVHASGRLQKRKIAELYDLWTNGEKALRTRHIRGRKGEAPGMYRRDCKARLKKMNLRVLNEETKIFELGHVQDVMHSGVQPVYRITLDDGKTLDCTTQHRLLTSEGWQTMEDAVGLVTNLRHEVLARTKSCEVLCNGVELQGIERLDALYTQKSWLSEQISCGLTARQIAQQCDSQPEVIRYWAKHFQLELNSGYKPGLKTVVGNGCYRDRHWLESQLAKGLHADEMAQYAGCSVEAIKKWVYKYGLKLNKRSPGTPTPWNKGQKGYTLQLSEESRQQRRENAKRYTLRGEASNFWKGGTVSERGLIAAWTRQIAPQVHQKFDYICQQCGVRGGELHAHHLVPVFADESLAYEFDNLISVCKRCHEDIHSHHCEAEFAQSYKPIVEPHQWNTKPKPKGRRLKAHAVKVVNVEYLGLQDTYDIEVEGPWHNFVANGMVVHNSFRYTGQRIVDVATGDRDVEDVFYLRPVGKYDNRQGKKYEYTPEQRQADLQWCIDGCKRYHQRVQEGLAEEHARGLIPFDARQHFVVSCNTRSLMHLLDLRWKRDAQLEAQKFCELLFDHFEQWSPAIAHWYQDNRAKKARLSP